MNLEGTRLGRYELRAEIGRGGMAVVYHGYDPSLNRSVAVKVLPPRLTWEKEFVERFLREARAAAALDHPHIVTIYDVGEAGGWYFFVMKYLEGRPLTHILRERGQLPPDEALSILRQLADALDYAHRREMFHRDVKPANVIVDPQGHATLTDFGLVRAAQASRITADGTAVGTPHYMSPEQVSGTSQLGSASDQYSLGVMAFQMLCGEPPFDADSTPTILFKHIYEPPPSITPRCPNLPPEVDQVLRRALAKEPEVRFPSGAAFVNALAEALKGRAEPLAAPPSPAKRFTWAWIAGGLTAVTLIIIGGVVMLTFSSRRDDDGQQPPTPTVQSTSPSVATSTPTTEPLLPTSTALPPTSTPFVATPTPTSAPTRTSPPYLIIVTPP